MPKGKKIKEEPKRLLPPPPIEFTRDMEDAARGYRDAVAVGDPALITLTRRDLHSALWRCRINPERTAWGQPPDYFPRPAVLGVDKE